MYLYLAAGDPLLETGGADAMIQYPVEEAGQDRGIATISPETWLWWVRRPRSSLSTVASVTSQGSPEPEASPTP